MDEHGPDVPDIVFNVRSNNKGFSTYVVSPLDQRKYLPTFADLIDRLTIVLLKQVFIPEHSNTYKNERLLIEHDIDLLLRQPVDAEMVTAIAVLMLTNRFIWENESKARQGGSEQDRLLKLTHSVNGVRTKAKNIIARKSGERVDVKVDALAADLPQEYGNWNIFEDE